MLLLRHQGKHPFMGRKGTKLHVVNGWGLRSSEFQISHSVITSLKEGCFLSTQIPWSFGFPLHPGEDKAAE